MESMGLFGKLESNDDPMFQLFWDAFDFKIAKGTARRAFRIACKKEYAHNIIMAAKQYAATRDPAKRQYWPHPATWLNGERWLEQQPKEEVQKRTHEAILDSVAWHVKRRIQSTKYGPADVEKAYRAGKVTAEECNAYGVRV